MGNERGVTLVSVLIGAALSIGAVLLIANGLTSISRALKGVVSHKERSIELQTFTAQLRKNFSRRQPGNFAMTPSPTFNAGSLCRDLSFDQTILPNKVRTISYQTVCDGPALASNAARNDLSPELSTGCGGTPRVRVQTTEPDGSVTTSFFPPPSAADAGVACFRLETGASGPSVSGEVMMASLVAEGRFKRLVQELRLGVDDAGNGIEIIPPQ